MSNSKPVRIPISNVYGGGDYTGAIQVGSNQNVANVILDTGSSTLAVKPTAYNAEQDKDLKPTSLAQDITYGTGGWAGPVVHSTVGFEHTDGNISLQGVPVAITDDAQQGNFGTADGIMGLAYGALNTAYDMTAILQKQKVNPPVTYPWPFKIPDNQQAIDEFQQELEQEATEQNVTPYFTALEQANVETNQFAFYTLRSSVHIASDQETYQEALNDPLNQGFLILGGGENETDLYTGTFQEVQVVDDEYYNVNLISVQVGSQPASKALPIQPDYEPSAGSNAIIDSGTNSLALAFDVYQDIITALGKINSAFVSQIHLATSNGEGIAAGDLDLSQWPDIVFGLQGPAGETVELFCAPQTYWQVNSPRLGYAEFKISGSPRYYSGSNEETANQSILGLTLMNNYFTIFDRSQGSEGVIKFATIKAPTN